MKPTTTIAILGAVVSTFLPGYLLVRYFVSDYKQLPVWEMVTLALSFTSPTLLVFYLAATVVVEVPEGEKVSHPATIIIASGVNST
jgi:hypothetical protein